MQNLDQELRVDNLVTPQDVATSGTVNTNSSMFRSMKNYRKGLVVVTAHLGDGKTAVGQLKSADDAAGTSSGTVSGKTCTLTGTAAAPEQVGTIEFDVNDLIGNDASEYFVGCSVTTDNNGDDVGAVLVRGAARYYKGSSMPA